MSTSTSIGFSQHPDPKTAILQACVHVKGQLSTPHTDLIIIFASPQYIIPELQETVTRTLKPKLLIGSSSGGIILSNHVANRGIAVIGINSDEMEFSVSAISDLDAQDIKYAGFDLARNAIQNLHASHREAFITFSQGIENNSSQFIRGIREILGGAFPLIGALSSDHFKYKNTAQLFQDKILHNSSVGLLVGGICKLGFGCAHNFKPLGMPRTITKVDGNIIRTIDNRPAVEIYEHFLGDHAQALNNLDLNPYTAVYPLGVYQEESGHYLLRNIIDILQDGSIVCHGGIPQGAEVHLMISNTDSCINAAVQAAELAKMSLTDRQAKLILVIESIAHQKILGRSMLGEIQAIKNVLGNNVPLAGMFSFGEIGPLGSQDNIKNIYLQNETILVVAIA